MSHIYSIVDYYGIQNVSKCGYCKTKEGHKDHGMWLYYLTVTDYQNLIDRGWRRSGNYGYKPITHDACCPLYTIRCSASDLKLSRSQKKLIKRFNRFVTHDERRKWHGKGENSTRDNMEVCCEQTVPANDTECAKISITKEPEVKKVEVLPSPQKPVEVTPEVKPSGDSNPNPRHEGKKKYLRIERAKQRVMAKGKTEQEAIEILKSKKRYPKPKTLEDFLSECDKPDGSAHKLRIEIVQSSPPNQRFESTFKEEYALYLSYQVEVHKDKPDKCNENQFRRFLVNSPLEPQYIGVPDAPVQNFGSYHQQYWLDDKLIAVGVIDILPRCLSSVYLFYDPKYSDLILGTYGSMRELQLVRELHNFVPSLQYYYMGYYIHSCAKMRYKARISPSYLLCPETYTWQPIVDCIKKIEEHGYSRLNENMSAKDENDATNYDSVLVLHRHNILRYSDFRRECEKEDTTDMREYVRSVGRKCAYSMLLFRG